MLSSTVVLSLTSKITYFSVYLNEKTHLSTACTQAQVIQQYPCNEVDAVLLQVESVRQPGNRKKEANLYRVVSRIICSSAATLTNSI